MGSNRKTPHIGRIRRAEGWQTTEKSALTKKEKVVRKGNLFVTEEISMAKYDKKKALKIIVDAAKEYNEKLRDNHFLIIYQENGKIKTVCVGFRDMNFLHMTGVKTHLSVQQFYYACLNGKLSERDFEMDNTGKVQQKLMVLPFLSELLYKNCMIGSFVNNGIYIRADYFVGNTKAVLSVGFRNGKNVDFPVTLYNEDVRKLSHPTNKVLAIFVKKYNQQNYTKCTYLSKGQEIGKLACPEEIKKLIQ